MKRIFTSILNFYIDGFRSMTVGKLLWTIILIKLTIMFCIIKPLYFTDTSKERGGEAGESQHVYDELVKRGR